MTKGSIKQAWKLLTNKMENGVLTVSKDTIPNFIQKHPKGKTVSKDLLLNGPLQSIHPVKFQSIDEEMIRMEIRAKRNSDPSGMGACGPRRILTLHNFKTSSSNLRKALANVVQKLCTDLIETHAIDTFLSCRLILLDWKPRLRPTGVGEFLRRIAGNVIASVLKKDLIKSTDTLPVFAELEAAMEAAIHSINMIYKDEKIHAIFLVDTGNALNSLNRQSFLHKLFMPFNRNIC